MKTTFFRKIKEPFIFLIIFSLIFGFLGYRMGIANMMNTIMRTAHDLLLNTVFYIMGITVLTGALGKLMIEFQVIKLLEKLLAPLMRPIFGLPGIASLGALITFLSDNPAIIALANDKKFSGYFKKYQLVSLTNFGTAFGMGLVVITFMIGQGYFMPALVGFLGAIVGATISTRLMQFFIKGKLQDDDQVLNDALPEEEETSSEEKNPTFLRVLNSLLDGGKQGVELGIAIIPGVLIISTLVMILTFGPKDLAIGYQGLAYEGVPLLPQIADYFSGVFRILFGFENPELIAFPITSLGAVGAALSVVKVFVAKNIITANAIAVFTAMGMCWSGFLSTHTAMMDTLNCRELTSKALISHTIGGIFAGVAAHYLYLLAALCF